MNKESNCGASMAIFLASLVLVAMTAKAEDKTPKNENLKLIWTSDCPEYKGSSNSNLCKKRIYADDSINIKELKWEEVEDIAKISFDWKYNLKQKFARKK